MALDFPASPTDGQLYSGANGVVYQWSASRGLWLSTPQALTSALANFMASGSGGVLAPPSTNTDYTSIFNTVMTGNAGNWYNPANGRFTPPAGRYLIGSTISMFSSSAAIYSQTILKKNGVKILSSQSNMNTHAASVYTTCHSFAEVDANGTDYFEVNSYCSVLWSGATGNFWAIPVGVVVPGQLLGEFQVTQNANFSLPANSFTVLSWNTVLAGNAGSWYSTATGRYTPPAGRHRLFGSLQGLCTSAIYVAMQFTKNGTPILPMVNYNVAANIWGSASIERIVDANGTDWFEMQGFTSVGAGSQFNGTFGASPIRV